MSCDHETRVAASRDAMGGAEAEHWHYRRDPLDGIGFLRLALWVLLLIPVLEWVHNLRQAWRQRKDRS